MNSEVLNFPPVENLYREKVDAEIKQLVGLVESSVALQVVCLSPHFPGVNRLLAIKRKLGEISGKYTSQSFVPDFERNLLNSAGVVREFGVSGFDDGKLVTMWHGLRRGNLPTDLSIPRYSLTASGVVAWVPDEMQQGVVSARVIEGVELIPVVDKNPEFMYGENSESSGLIENWRRVFTQDSGFVF